MCGIFGIISEKPIPFDYTKFCVLGVDNDSRGGDSCGIFIDGNVEYGVAAKKLFKNFYQESEVLNDTNKAAIAVGHCRKASVGAINEKTAQPVVIYKDDKPEFVVLHNGTIYNYKELAEKYIPDIDITGMTDSQVMAHIFYHAGYNVLSEYNGGAVFVIIDYRSARPEVLLFRGESKKYNAVGEAVEERPLFFCIDEGVLTFSSIDDYLPIVCRNSQVYYPTGNNLISFRDGTVFVKLKIDRSKCCQMDTSRKSIGTVFTGYYGTSTSVVYRGIITHVLTNNTYKIESRVLNGQYFISHYGAVYEAKPQFMETTSYWFFNGIAFDRKDYYDVVWKKYLKSKRKEMDDFVNDNRNLIRYLSKDRVVIIEGVAYIVEGPAYLKLFDGDLVPIGSSRAKHYSDGKYSYETHASDKRASHKADVNFSELKKLWIL
jgi:hypothetical protein